MSTSWPLHAASEPVSPLNRAKSGKIGHFQTFELYQPYFGFWLLHGQDVIGSYRKVAEKIPCTKITLYYLRRHLHRRQPSAFVPEIARNI